MCICTYESVIVLAKNCNDFRLCKLNLMVITNSVELDHSGDQISIGKLDLNLNRVEM